MTATTQHESLMQALERVPDPRSRQGRRYELRSVLGLAVCAMAAGARSLYAIAQWGREHCQMVCEALGIRRERTPDVEAFGAVLGDCAAVWRAGGSNIAAALRTHAGQPHRAIALVTSN